MCTEISRRSYGKVLHILNVKACVLYLIKVAQAVFVLCCLVFECFFVTASMNPCPSSIKSLFRVYVKFSLYALVDDSR